MRAGWLKGCRAINDGWRIRHSLRRGMLLALLLLVSGARAAGTYDAALRDGVAARDRALETQRARDWQQAFEHFGRAVAAEDTTAARFELAVAAGQLGLIDVAYESFEVALARGLSGKAKAQALEFLGSHAGEVARLEVVAAPGSAVFVNGRARGSLPLSGPLVVPAGRVRLRVVSPQAEPWEKSVQMDARVVMRLAPELESEPATYEEGSWIGSPGRVALLSVAGASLAAGGLLAFEASRKQDKADDAERQIISALSSHVDTGVITPDAVPCGNDGIASGTVVFRDGVSRSYGNQLIQDYRNACDLFSSRRAAADRLRTLSYLGLGVGLGASAALITWYIARPGAQPASDDGSRRAHAPRILPLLSRDVQGALLQLAF